MTETLKYPYEWGEKTASALFDKYPRGTYTLAIELEMSPGMLKHEAIMILCSGNSPHWELMRAAIKASNRRDPTDAQKLFPEAQEVLYKRIVLGKNIAL